MYMEGILGTIDIQRKTPRLRLPSAMVARLASIAQRYQKVAGSSPAVVIFYFHLVTAYTYNERSAR
jgi:hypothetical protein